MFVAKRSLVTSIAFSLFSFVVGLAPGFPYGSQKVRGVNIGGWLVLEVSKFNSNQQLAADPSSALDYTIFVR